MKVKPGIILKDTTCNPPLYFKILGDGSQDLYKDEGHVWAAQVLGEPRVVQNLTDLLIDVFGFQPVGRLEALIVLGKRI